MIATTSRHVNPVPAANSDAKIFNDLLAGPKRPSYWFDAKDLGSASAQTLRSRSESRPAALTVGADTTVSTSDPVIATKPSGVHIITSNLAAGGNYVWSTHATINPTTSVKMAWRGVIAGTPVSSIYFCGGRGTQYQLIMPGGDRKIRVGVYSTTGVTFVGNALSTNTVPESSEPVWIEATLIQATAECSYRYSFDQVERYSDVVNWETLGGAVGIGAGQTLNSLSGGTAALSFMVGHASEGAVANALCDTYGGILFSDDVQIAEIYSSMITGQSTFGTWTVVRSTGGIPTLVVQRPTISWDGSDDKMLTPGLRIDFDKSFTLMVMLNKTNYLVDDRFFSILATRASNVSSSTELGIMLRESGASGFGSQTTALAADGASFVESSTTNYIPFGTDAVRIYRFDKENQTLEAAHFHTGALHKGTLQSTAALGSVNSSAPIVIGQSTSGAYPMHGQTSVPLIRCEGALTDAELKAFCTVLLEGGYE